MIHGKRRADELSAEHRRSIKQIGVTIEPNMLVRATQVIS